MRKYSSVEEFTDLGKTYINGMVDMVAELLPVGATETVSTSFRMGGSFNIDMYIYMDKDDVYVDFHIDNMNHTKVLTDMHLACVHHVCNHMVTKYGVE